MDTNTSLLLEALTSELATLTQLAADGNSLRGSILYNYQENILDTIQAFRSKEAPFNK